MRSHRTASLPLAVCLLAFTTGCQTYSDKSSARDSAYQSGNYGAAASRADADAARHGAGKDGLLYRLEQGAILRAAALAERPSAAGQLAAAPSGANVPASLADDAPLPSGESSAPPARVALLRRSVAALTAADTLVEASAERAQVSLSAELTGFLTNQQNTPYRGQAYDQIMLSTYQALNYLELGELAAARVELDRALQRQREALAANARRLASAARQPTTGTTTDPDAIERVLQDPNASARLRAAEAELDRRIRDYGDYVNPFTVFLDALVFTYAAEDASDRERGRLSFKRVAELAPENAYAVADFAAAESLAQGTAAPTPLTYVIFETGNGAVRDQLRVDIPVAVASDRISYIGAAFPRIQFIDNHATALAVTTPAGTFATSIIGSMDAVIARDFRNEWPTILTKTILTTATKATADAAVQNNLKGQGETTAVIGQLATLLTQYGLNVADTRSWRSLPKEFQYVRVPTPPDRRLSLSTGVANRTIRVAPGLINVIYVKSTAASAPLLVSQFRLR
jgi:uncharacterized protein